ncbi:Fc.00g025950.m01.CDS01 [Cosmosporella sp. VM-42]
MPLREGADKGGLDSASRHVCHCGKSFIRKEHLTRHRASHDGAAFICDKCPRQFSRKDLLRRHVLLHEVRNPRAAVSCDACRTNKTKCSGGPSCSLCTRRGILCSLNQDVSKPVHTSSDQDGEAVSDSQEASTLGSSLTEAVRGAEKGARSANLDFFSNLTIVPTQRRPRADFQPIGAGMEGIYEMLVAGHSSLNEVLQESHELKAWVAKSGAAYLQYFHIRWPVLHAPTLEIEQDPLLLTATVCMIGAWLQGPEISVDRFYALRVHEFLLQRFLQDIVDAELSSGEKEWPIDFFRAVLLNLVFSLYRTEETILSKTMLLRSLFIAYLKRLGLFSSTALATHQQRHCPGTWPLYLLQTRERYKKLAGLVFQLDTYLALAHGQPPMLHRQEMNVELSPTFSLWNAFGIMVCSKRLSEEPAGRTASMISEMTKSPGSFKSSPLLIEDIQLGMCGILQTVWVLAESFPVLVIDKLDSWKTELDKTNDLINADNFTTGGTNYLLLAYRGEENSATAALERITTLLQDAMVLYYFLKLYALSGLRISGDDVLRKKIEDPPTQAWKPSINGREALICALEMLKTMEGFHPSAACLNPLIWHALTAGANLTKELTSGQICECQMKEGQTRTNLDSQRNPEMDGPVVFDGVLVCVCNLDIWMARFDKALKSQNGIIE